MQNDSAAPGKESSPIERRLATILMADVYGYSKMMGEDEERTVRIFRGHRAVFDELLLAHRGRIFNTAGDAVLAEFPSAVEAVRAATEIQAALRTRNEQLPEAQRMWFRIGINLGDVIVQGDDLLGDGVNVAARIQTVAEPGGVCISGSVYDQIQNKLTLQIRQLGEKTFKNIAQPVRTFSISDDGSVVSGARWRASRKGPFAIAAGVVAAVVAIGAAGYWWYQDHDAQVAEQARVARLAEAQRKAEVDKVAAEAAAKESQLQAQLQSAKDALTQAEASKRKAEGDRAAAEAAQREAKMQAELKATKDALQKASDAEKKAEEARVAAAAALQASEAATAKASEKGRNAATTKGAANERPATASGTPARVAAKGVDRFDGSYLGRMCTINADGSSRCWPVTINLQHGAVTAEWVNRISSQPSHAKGTMATDGTVKLAIDGFTSKGQALGGEVTGTVVDNKLTVSGNWSNGLPVHATWLLGH